MERLDVIIVGGGIVGAACARALARDGHRVRVLEASMVGGGTTAEGMGHTLVLDDNDAELALTTLSTRLWADLAPSLPPECEDVAAGTLWLARDDDEMRHVARKASYESCGIAAAAVSPAELRVLEPHLRDGLAGALLVKGDRIMYPPNAARWLLERAVADGAEVRENVPVTGLADHEVEAGGERHRADVVLLTAGLATADLVSELPIRPRKGQLAITDRFPGLLRHHLIELAYLDSAHGSGGATVACGIQPRVSGQVLVGSSREFAGRDRSINRKLLGRMLERASSYVPALRGLPVIRTWTGFRPATPDNLPLIGPWPPVEGLWVAAGHEGIGITTSLGTAVLVADALAGRAPPLDPTPYRADRVLEAPA